MNCWNSGLDPPPRLHLVVLYHFQLQLVKRSRDPKPSSSYVPRTSLEKASPCPLPTGSPSLSCYLTSYSVRYSLLIKIGRWGRRFCTRACARPGRRPSSQPRLLKKNKLRGKDHQTHVGGGLTDGRREMRRGSIIPAEGRDASY